MRDPRTGRLLRGDDVAVLRTEDLCFADDPSARSGRRPRASSCRRAARRSTRIWVIAPGEDDGAALRSAATPASCSRAATEARPGSSTRSSGSSRPRPELAAGRRRPVPALDRYLAGRPGAARGRRLGGRGLADRRRRASRGGTATRASSRATCPRRRDDADHAPLCVHHLERAPSQPGAAVHAVPRRRLPLRRRRGELDRDRRRPAVGLRLPAGGRPGRPGQRVRDPARRRHGPCHPRGRVRVYETRDAGATWTARGDGLPQSTPT